MEKKLDPSYLIFNPYDVSPVWSSQEHNSQNPNPSHPPPQPEDLLEDFPNPDQEDESSNSQLNTNSFANPSVQSASHLSQNNFANGSQNSPVVSNDLVKQVDTIFSSPRVLIPPKFELARLTCTKGDLAPFVLYSDRYQWFFGRLREQNQFCIPGGNISRTHFYIKVYWFRDDVPIFKIWDEKSLNNTYVNKEYLEHWQREEKFGRGRLEGMRHLEHGDVIDVGLKDDGDISDFSFVFTSTIHNTQQSGLVG